MSKMQSRIEKLERERKTTTFIRMPIEGSNCWIKWILSQPAHEEPQNELARLLIELRQPADSQEAIWHHEFRLERISYLEAILSGKAWLPDSDPKLGAAVRALNESLELTQTR